MSFKLIDHYTIEHITQPQALLVFSDFFKKNKKQKQIIHPLLSILKDCLLINTLKFRQKYPMHNKSQNFPCFFSKNRHWNQ